MGLLLKLKRLGKMLSIRYAHKKFMVWPFVPFGAFRLYRSTICSYNKEADTRQYIGTF